MTITEQRPTTSEPKALATRRAPVPIDVAPTSLDDTFRIAEVFAKSGFFADTRELAQCVTKILAGKELGFGPMASMQGVYIVKGRVTLSANLIGSAIQRSGKYGYEIGELTNERCVLHFYSRDDPRRHADGYTSTFTLEDAQKAGLANSETYKKFPRNMLFARALTNGARFYCPEVFLAGPIYTPDELGADVDGEGRVIEIGHRITDTATGEVLSEAPAYVPARERDPAQEAADAAALEEALISWQEACTEADRLGIPHKELPAGSSLERVEKWTLALVERINEREEEPF